MAHSRGHRTIDTTHRQREEDDHFQEVASFSGNELALDPNVYTKVFRQNILEGRGMRYGRGQSENPLQARGFIAAHFRDNTATTSVQILGGVKITIRPDGDPGALTAVVFDGDLEDIDSRNAAGDLLDRRDRKPYAAREIDRGVPLTATKEYSAYVEVKPNSAATIDTAPDSDSTELFADGVKVVRAG